MKLIKLLILLVLSWTTLPAPALAITETTKTVNNRVATEPSAKQKLFNAFKFRQKKDFDMSHPVKKWLWLSILLLIIGAVLWALKLYSFSHVAYVVAGICLIVWLLKFVQIL